MKQHAFWEQKDEKRLRNTKIQLNCQEIIVNQSDRKGFAGKVRVTQTKTQALDLYPSLSSIVRRYYDRLFSKFIV